MGGGTWTSRDYDSYAASTSYTTKSTQEVFANSNIVATLDPKNIRLRESCDSADNPNATPLIFALDVTGSMGSYAAKIAKDALPELMTRLHEEQPVKHPHLMFMGVDDVHCHSRGVFQVSQFEADLRILEQLREIFLAGGGGSNRSESYDLPWWFAANRTKTDSFDKRGEKGFLFTLGDEEAPYQDMTPDKFEEVFGPGQYETLTPAEMLAQAKEKYHVFHIVIEQGNGYGGGRARAVRDTWTQLMGPNVLFLKDFTKLADVVTGVLRIVRGADIDTVISESQDPATLRHALSNALNEAV